MEEFGMSTCNKKYFLVQILINGLRVTFWYIYKLLALFQKSTTNVLHSVSRKWWRPRDQYLLQDIFLRARSTVVAGSQPIKEVPRTNMCGAINLVAEAEIFSIFFTPGEW